jgi:hypothetical protein
VDRITVVCEDGTCFEDLPFYATGPARVLLKQHGQWQQVTLVMDPAWNPGAVRLSRGELRSWLPPGVPTDQAWRGCA